MIKILFLSILVLLTTSCSLVTTAPVDTSRTISGENQSPQERLQTGVHYGSGNHQVTVFADFQCPACIRFSHTVMPLLESYAATGKLVIVYKQYPLTTIHKNAYRDSLAALCAERQGKYMEYKPGIYGLEESKNGATVTDNERIAIIEGISGIDTQTFTQCLSSDEQKSVVDRDMADGDALGISGTPTLFFDGKRIDFSVFQNLDQIEQFFASRIE